MPTPQEHIEKQSRTQLALSDLQQSENSCQHGDWLVTLAFYKVLHAVDSYFAKQEIDPQGHERKWHKMRDQQVQDHLSYIYPQYDALYKASMKARYEADIHEPQEVKTLVNDSVFIEEYIKTLLESP